MKPTIGRTVHFHSPNRELPRGPDGETGLDTYAAIITAVYPAGTFLVAPDERVDLVTFGPRSIYHHDRVPFSETPSANCWTWPPRVG